METVIDVRGERNIVEMENRKNFTLNTIFTIYSYGCSVATHGHLTSVSIYDLGCP
jgi:hypothetical protein